MNIDQPQFPKIDVQDSELSFMKDGERRTFHPVAVRDKTPERRA
jgi:hypothetical protein